MPAETGPSALAQAGEAGRLLGVDRASRGAAPDNLGDLTRGLERPMRARQRHEAADVRRRDDVLQPRQVRFRDLIRRTAHVDRAAGDATLDHGGLKRRFVGQVAP
jgi:hypothetical protein